MSHPLIGVAFVVLGALMLSAKGVVAKFLYAAGADVITVAAVRSVLAVPGFWLWAMVTLGRRRLFAPDPAALRAAIGVGFVSYYFCGYLDFYALTLIDASLERVILFSYPVVIVTARAILDRRLPPLYVTVALVVTYAGVFMVVGAFDQRLLESNAFGAALVMVAACGVALYYMVNEKASRAIGSQAFTVYGMTAAGFGMACHFALTNPVSALVQPPEFWWLMLLMVVGVTILPLFLLAEGIARIGATRGSLISTVGPPSTIVMAWWFLDERLAPSQFVGCALIIGGIVYLEWRGQRERRRLAKGAAQPGAPVAARPTRL